MGSLSDAVKLAGLVLSLGFDTLAVSIGLGLSGLAGRQRVRFGVAFAVAEGGMPLVGFLLGRILAEAIGSVAGYAAIALLLAVGLYLLREGWEGEQHTFESAGPLAVVTLALSVSMDELAVGFSLGLLRLPVVLAVVLIAAQAFVLTSLGIAIGQSLGARFAARAGVLSGLALIVLALFLLLERLRGA
jgi:manganese efflux pump family protein